MKSCRLSDNADGVDYLATLISAKSILSNPSVAKKCSHQPTAGLMPIFHSEPEYLNNILANLPVAPIALDEHDYLRFCNEMAVHLVGYPLINQLWRNMIGRSIEVEKHGWQ